MTAAPATLSVHGLAYRYAERAVLHDVSFDVHAGEVVALMGPNGCGKSTTLSVLGGLTAPQGGTVRFEGRTVARGDRALRAELGFVFQSPSLDVKLTARQNLALAARMHGLSGAAASEAVSGALMRAGLESRAGDAVETLSGGMRRRLDIARAMLHGPRVLLLDEPTTGLDERAWRLTWQQIRQIATGGDAAVLLTTHRPEEAERADRVLVMDAGRIVADDTPHALLARVQGDVIVLRAADPEALAGELARRLDLHGVVEGRDVHVTAPRGHELIVRIVEDLPRGLLSSVSLRQPGLGDVFLALTGGALDSEPGTADDALEVAA
ncbi:MAG: ABC transporter ATP-binding protein [Deltaproteobacteria bacterium]|nr:ABC transporter ATP-binding protein [Deltaproteobacteria bacterium]MCB9788290.1 ABC transporter ATP-binding protein [Deltaproteobacteria bacterium]